MSSVMNLKTYHSPTMRLTFQGGMDVRHSVRFVFVQGEEIPPLEPVKSLSEA